jgi:hypothetical protein
VLEEETREVGDEEGPGEIEEPEVELKLEPETEVAFERSEEVVQFAEVELAF